MQAASKVLFPAGEVQYDSSKAKLFIGFTEVESMKYCTYKGDRVHPVSGRVQTRPLPKHLRPK